MTANNEPRPSDPLTAQDAAKIMSDFAGIKGELLQEIRSINDRIDEVSGKVEAVRSTVKFWSTDLAVTRESRTNLELHELDKEEEILKQRLAIVREKRAAKSNEKNLSDSQKLRAIAASSWQERERLEQEARAKWWRETFQIAGRAIIIGFGVSFAGGIVAFIWWLVQLYLNR
jgi:hypothetical protein